MPAPSPLTTAQLSEYLINKFGTKVNANHLKIAARHFGLQYETISKRLKEFKVKSCLLYTSPSPRDATLSRMPSSA